MGRVRCFSEPSANLQCIAAVCSAKLRVEVARLSENDAPLRKRDGRNGHKQHRGRVSGESDAGVQEREGQVGWIAAETERAGCDESDGGLVCVKGCMRLRQGFEHGHQYDDRGCQ